FIRKKYVREKPPYFCYGCQLRSRCQLEKCFYYSGYARNSMKKYSPLTEIVLLQVNQNNNT
ncbi:MAG: hypothetical protein WCS04_03595, partial [Sphaerochaetaceae bacterium]